MRRLTLVSHLGLRYRCPVCGWRFRRLLAGGSVSRKNAQCPRCGSLERHRHLWLYLQARSDLFETRQRVLHISPEPELERRLRRRTNLDYLSVDIEPGRAMEVMDITNIPLPDASFDSILCVHVLELIEDDFAAMRELRRVLRPGGWAVLQVPIGGDRTVEDFRARPLERLQRFGDRGHVRSYGHRDYPERLEEAGFRVNVEVFVPAAEVVDRCRLVPSGYPDGDPRPFEVYRCTRTAQG